MDVLTDDHEREEAVRKWWHEYWKPITLGVVIALAGLVGFRQYQAYELSKSQETAYEVYLHQQALNKSGITAVDEAKAFALENEDIYGALLSIEIANVQIAAGQFDKALESVNFARENGGDLVVPMATIIESKIMAQNKDYDGAIKNLTSLKDEAYQIELNETLGDIYLAKGDRDAAHDAYKKAVDLCVKKDVEINPMLTIKFDNLIKKGDKPAFEISLERQQDKL